MNLMNADWAPGRRRPPGAQCAFIKFSRPTDFASPPAGCYYPVLGKLLLKSKDQIPLRYLASEPAGNSLQVYTLLLQELIRR